MSIDRCPLIKTHSTRDFLNRPPHASLCCGASTTLFPSKSHALHTRDFSLNDLHCAHAAINLATYCCDSRPFKRTRRIAHMRSEREVLDSMLQNYHHFDAAYGCADSSPRANRMPPGTHVSLPASLVPRIPSLSTACHSLPDHHCQLLNQSDANKDLQLYYQRCQQHCLQEALYDVDAHQFDLHQQRGGAITRSPNFRFQQQRNMSNTVYPHQTAFDDLHPTCYCKNTYLPVVTAERVNASTSLPVALGQGLSSQNIPNLPLTWGDCLQRKLDSTQQDNISSFPPSANCDAHNQQSFVRSSLQKKFEKKSQNLLISQVEDRSVQSSCVSSVFDDADETNHCMGTIIEQTCASPSSTPEKTEAPKDSFTTAKNATTKTSRPSSNARSSSAKEDKWMTMFEELKRFKSEHGNCIVPRGYAFNTRLASWVAEQRKQYSLLQQGRNTNMTLGRVGLLEGIDFAWNAQEAAWYRHFEDLKKYKAASGNCMVPLRNTDAFPQLGLWVKEQRRHYILLRQNKHSHLTQERVRMLENVGFCWDSHEAIWWERIRELEEYKRVHGDCKVPTKYTPNPGLGTWVHHQRRQYNLYCNGEKSHMTEPRIRTLNKMGFLWRSSEKRSLDSSSGSTAASSQGEVDSLIGEVDVN